MKTVLMGKVFAGKYGMKAGIESGFIPISKHVGIKLFIDKESRDYAAKTQKYASELLIGPKVGQKFSLYLPVSRYGMLETNTLYCYITERAQRVGKTRVSHEFVDKIRDAGLATWDLHNHNVGRVGKRTVLIDFGETTTIRR